MKRVAVIFFAAGALLRAGALLLMLLMLLLGAGAANGARAQGIARICAELARPSGLGAVVELTVAPDAAAAIAAADIGSGLRQTVAYRVRVFSDNTQNARANAYAAAAKFSEMFDFTAEVTYESPWFIVTAGHFFDRTDAIALRGRALAQFPLATVVQQQASVATVLAGRNTDNTTD